MTSMRLLAVSICVVVVVLGLWTAGSLYILKGVATPAYEVISDGQGYEVRRYPSLLVAETRDRSGAEGDQMFRVLASFIFGDNQGNNDIAMTAPVLIADSGPELGKAPQRTMQFIMPREFTEETIPQPKSDRIKLRKIASRLIAARKFRWFASKEKQLEQQTILLAALRRDGLKVVGEPIYASYQPPFAVPFLKRHEMLVEVVRQRDS